MCSMASGLRRSARQLLAAPPRVRRAAAAAQQPRAWEWEDLQHFRRFSLDEWLVGRVRHTTSYGTWVEVPVAKAVGSVSGCSVCGLVHATEQAAGAEDILSTPGHQVHVRIAHVDVERGHLALSMLPPAEPSDLLEPFQGIHACTWLPASVREVLLEGILLDVEHPRGGASAAPGLVRPAELDGLSRLGCDLASWFLPGQAAQVRIVGMDELAKEPSAASPAEGRSQPTAEEERPEQQQENAAEARLSMAAVRTRVLRLSMRGGPDHLRADVEAQLQELTRSQRQPS